MSDFNVLITSSSKKAGLVKAVRAAMAKAAVTGKLYCGDTNEEALSRYFCDEFWKMPPTDEQHSEEILAWCRTHGVLLIVPSRDGELKFWADREENLHSFGVTVMVGRSESVCNCQDKLQFAKILLEKGLPAIRTFSNANDVTGDLFVVKERYGAGAKNIAIGVDRNLAMQKAKELAFPVYQPFISGTEYSVDFYVTRDRQIKGAIVRERNQVIDGESQVTTTVSCPAIEALCRRVTDVLDLYGHNILQVIASADGKHHIVECNPRFGGASTASLSAGLDSFYWLILEALGEDLNVYPFQRIPGQIKQVRYPEDLILPA